MRHVQKGKDLRSLQENQLFLGFMYERIAQGGQRQPCHEHDGILHSMVLLNFLELFGILLVCFVQNRILFV